MKKRLASILMVLVLLAGIIPFTTVSAEASTGRTTLVKSRTITIKPGKTYKTPAFKLKKGMALMVPVEAWLSPKDKGKTDYITKGGFKLTLKTAKGKTIDTFTESLVNADRHYEQWYMDWIYFYHKSIAKPKFSKGKYYYTFKNTTKRTIKVKYAVYGYTKFATKGSFKSKVTANEDERVKIGTVGPGIPLLKSVTSSNPDVEVYNWWINDKGTLYIWAYGEKSATTTVTVKLKNGGKKYKVKLKYVAYQDEEDV